MQGGAAISGAGLRSSDSEVSQTEHLFTVLSDCAIHG